MYNGSRSIPAKHSCRGHLSSFRLKTHADKNSGLAQYQNQITNKAVHILVLRYMLFATDYVLIASTVEVQIRYWLNLTSLAM